MGGNHVTTTTTTHYLPSRRAVLAGLAASPLALAAGRAFAQPTSGTLSIAVFDWAEIGVKPVFAAYEAARPGVKIDYSVLPSSGPELRQTLISRRLANKLPDITYLADIFATQFADAQITADMRPFLNSGGPITMTSLAKPFLDQYLVVSGSNKDGIFGLPIGADTVVLYFNKKHFDEAGIPYPDDSWTFEKQIEVATQLTQKNGNITTRYGLAASVPWHATYVPGIEAFGDTLLDENNMYKLQSEAAIKVFTMYWDAVKAGVLASTTQINQLGTMQQAFGSGAASMIQSVRALVPSIRDAMTDDWDVALEPTINGVRKTGMGSIAQAITPQGEANNKELAHDYLNWFYSEDGGMKVLTSTYGTVPPVEALYNSPIWTELPGPPYDNRVFAESIQYGAMNPTSIPADVQAVVDAELLKAEEAVVLNGVAVPEALKTAEAVINEAMARVMAAGG
jgi:ABC-type glycerol-3-phosphate transport system substrate-binding protein